MRISLITMPVLVVYLPVSSEALYGAQTGWPDTVWHRSVHSLLQASMFGVSAFVSPA